MELVDLKNLVCPGCHEQVDDGNEGFVHAADGSPLCAGETEPMEVRDMTDSEAIDVIARILRDPQWSVAMLEDIAEVVAATGRNLETPDDDSTWERH